MFNIDNSKSYATEANLEKALKKAGATDQDRYVVVCNRQGRFTAIFPKPMDSDVARWARLGFLTIG